MKYAVSLGKNPANCNIFILKIKTKDIASESDETQASAIWAPRTQAARTENGTLDTSSFHGYSQSLGSIGEHLPQGPV